MKVVVNAQLLHTRGGYRGAGVSNYCRNLLTALADKTDGTKVTAFVNDRDFRFPYRRPGMELRYTALAGRRSGAAHHLGADGAAACCDDDAGEPCARPGEYVAAGDEGAWCCDSS